jgi:hypothetical protein
MKVIKFSNEGGIAPEQASQKWVADTGRLRVRGVAVTPSVANEGWLQIRDSATVNDDAVEICTVQATKDNPTNSYNFPGKGYPIVNGLYLRKAADCIAYIYVD